MLVEVVHVVTTVVVDVVVEVPIESTITLIIIPIWLHSNFTSEDVPGMEERFGIGLLSSLLIGGGHNAQDYEKANDFETHLE